MIATTLNIHVDVLTKINQIAAELRKSRKEIIILLFKRMMMDQRVLSRGFSTVRYQEDDEKENWHTFHIRFREDDNEFFVDLRKISKFSVSCLLAIAVKRYLGILIEDLKNRIVDNYSSFKNYVLYREVVDGIISWHFYWGFPEKHLKTLRL